MYFFTFAYTHFFSVGPNIKHLFATVRKCNASYTHLIWLCSLLKKGYTKGRTGNGYGGCFVACFVLCPRKVTVSAMGGWPEVTIYIAMLLHCSGGWNATGGKGKENLTIEETHISVDHI